VPLGARRISFSPSSAIEGESPIGAAPSLEGAGLLPAGRDREPPLVDYGHLFKSAERCSVAGSDAACPCVTWKVLHVRCAYTPASAWRN